MKRRLLFAALLGLSPVLFAEPQTYTPEPGSVELKKKKKSSKKVEIDPALPMVLIIGDSISIGYTGPVRELLAGKANVIHNPGNSQGTTHTKANLDSWIEANDKWDVIHFNLGLHDLKHVKVAGTSENSNDPNDPQQADLATYESNMKEIVARLKQTDAKLVFATTTPYPAGVKPLRIPEDAGRYNEVASKIMEANAIPVNDLYSAILPKLGDLQKPVNVHFTPEGSAFLAEKVSAEILKALGK